MLPDAGFGGNARAGLLGFARLRCAPLGASIKACAVSLMRGDESTRASGFEETGKAR